MHAPKRMRGWWVRSFTSKTRRVPVSIHKKFKKFDTGSRAVLLLRLFFIAQALLRSLPRLTSKVTCFRGAPSDEEEEDASRRRMDLGVVGLTSEMAPVAAISLRATSSADIRFV